MLELSNSSDLTALATDIPGCRQAGQETSGTSTSWKLCCTTLASHGAALPAALHTTPMHFSPVTESVRTGRVLACDAQIH